jgi:hypothetical protein
MKIRKKCEFFLVEIKVYRNLKYIRLFDYDHQQGTIVLHVFAQTKVFGHFVRHIILKKRKLNVYFKYTDVSNVYS